MKYIFIRARNSRKCRFLWISLCRSWCFYFDIGTIANKHIYKSIHAHINSIPTPAPAHWANVHLHHRFFGDGDLDWIYFRCWNHSFDRKKLREMPNRFFLHAIQRTSSNVSNEQWTEPYVLSFVLYLACCSNVFQKNNDIFRYLYQSTGNGITFSLIANYLWDKWTTDDRTTLFIPFSVSFVYFSFFSFV